MSSFPDRLPEGVSFLQKPFGAEELLTAVAGSMRAPPAEP